MNASRPSVTLAIPYAIIDNTCWCIVAAGTVGLYFVVGLWCLTTVVAFCLGGVSFDAWQRGHA